MKKENKKAKKSNKAVIISVSAAAVIVAAILIAVFVIKPSVDAKNPAQTEQPQTSERIKPGEETAEYMGCKMPAYAAQVMKDADEDSKAACKKCGIALKIGDYEMSLPEFELNYFRYEVDLGNEAQRTIEQNGMNTMGFEPGKAPSEQFNAVSKTNWDERIKESIAEEWQKRIYLFNEALKANYLPDNETLYYMSEEYNMFVNGKDDIDGYIASVYGENVTFDMFFKRKIITYYSDSYEVSLKETAEKSYDEADIDAIFKENPQKYRTATVRIYPIIRSDNLEEARKVSNLEMLYQFAGKDGGYSRDAAEKSTLFTDASYTEIADYLGEEVSEWIFSDQRRQGEFGIARGYIYNCIVYMQELPKVNHSADILWWGVSSDEAGGADAAYSEVKEQYDGLAKDGITESSFKEAFDDDAVKCSRTFFPNEVETVVADWIFAPERKNGECVCLKGEQASYIVYFIKSNPDDLQSSSMIRKEKAEADTNEAITSGSEKLKYKFDDKITAAGIKSAEKRYIDYYAEKASNNKNS